MKKVIKIKAPNIGSSSLVQGKGPNHVLMDPTMEALDKVRKAVKIGRMIWDGVKYVKDTK